MYYKRPKKHPATRHMALRTKKQASFTRHTFDKYEYDAHSARDKSVVQPDKADSHSPSVE